MNNTVATIGAVGTAAAATAGGPLAEVFNQLALTLALMGASGGITRGLATRLEWTEVIRGGVIGAFFAVGFGAISPQIAEKFFGLKLEAGAATVPVLAALAFATGFAQDVLIAALHRGKKDDA